MNIDFLIFLSLIAVAELRRECKVIEKISVQLNWTWDEVQIGQGKGKEKIPIWELWKKEKDGKLNKLETNGIMENTTCKFPFKFKV